MSLLIMADIEVTSDLRSNLFYQSGLISSVNECVGCIELNSKLKCALDEISSLNLIIKFLLNELKCIGKFGHCPVYLVQKYR
jgi:hypothetical protein